MAKRALITGVGGQDGSYMAELLLEKGYEVYGMARRASSDNLQRVAHLMDKITIVAGDLSDEASVKDALLVSEPHEIYNLGAMSFVPNSWVCPEYTFNVNCLGLLRLIQGSASHVKIYQASTSEMYGNSYPNFNPISPYGISKLGAHHIASAYRQRGRFISCGICFNHESPRRGREFVTQKIASFAKRKEGKLKLGNLDASRDWGFAGDFVEAMWLTLQQDTPRDFEIATGETHTIREFLDIAIPEWSELVEVDSSFIRPNEVHVLKGNPSDIKKIGWSPKVDFRGLVEMMCK